MMEVKVPTTNNSYDFEEMTSVRRNGNLVSEIELAEDVVEMDHLKFSDSETEDDPPATTDKLQMNSTDDDDDDLFQDALGLDTNKDLTSTQKDKTEKKNLIQEVKEISDKIDQTSKQKNDKLKVQTDCENEDPLEKCADRAEPEKSLLNKTPSENNKDSTKNGLIDGSKNSNNSPLLDKSEDSLSEVSDCDLLDEISDNNEESDMILNRDDELPVNDMSSVKLTDSGNENCTEKKDLENILSKTVVESAKKSNNQERSAVETVENIYESEDNDKFLKEITAVLNDDELHEINDEPVESVDTKSPTKHTNLDKILQESFEDIASLAAKTDKPIDETAMENLDAEGDEKNKDADLGKINSEIVFEKIDDKIIEDEIDPSAIDRISEIKKIQDETTTKTTVSEIETIEIDDDEDDEPVTKRQRTNSLSDDAKISLNKAISKESQDENDEKITVENEQHLNEDKTLAEEEEKLNEEINLIEDSNSPKEPSPGSKRPFSPTEDFEQSKRKRLSESDDHSPLVESTEDQSNIHSSNNEDTKDDTVMIDLDANIEKEQAVPKTVISETIDQTDSSENTEEIEMRETIDSLEPQNSNKLENNESLHEETSQIDDTSICNVDFIVIVNDVGQNSLSAEPPKYDDSVVENEEISEKSETVVVDETDELNREDSDKIVGLEVDQPDTQKIESIDSLKPYVPETKDLSIIDIDLLKPLPNVVAKKKIPLEYFKKFKKAYSEMTRSDLEELVMQKIVEAIVHKSEYSEMRIKIETQEQIIQSFRTKITELNKQYRDLEMVHNRVVKDLEIRNSSLVIPVKITRAVGLQVSQPRKQVERTSRTATPTPPPPPLSSPLPVPATVTAGISTLTSSVSISPVPVIEIQQVQQQTSTSISAEIKKKNKPNQKITPMRPPLSEAQQRYLVQQQQQQKQQLLQKHKEQMQQLQQQQAKNVAKTVISPIRTIPPMVQATRAVIVQQPIQSPQQPRIPPVILKKSGNTTRIIPTTSIVNNFTKSTEGTVTTKITTSKKDLNSKSIIDLTDEEDNRREANKPMILNGIPALVAIPAQKTQSMTIVANQRITRQKFAATSYLPIAPKIAQVKPNQSQVIPVRRSTGHPAPLPLMVNQVSKPGMKRIPTRPIIRISKVETGFVVSWTMDDMTYEHESVKDYQIFAYQENSEPPSTTNWRHVGDVKSLQLPMAVTLSQFQEGQRYYFAVRARDIYNRYGMFSVPRTWQ